MHIEQSDKRGGAEYSMICSYCGRLIKGPEAWERNARGHMELLASSKSQGVCPDCLFENYPQEYLAIQDERRMRIKNIFKRGYIELYGHLVK